MLCAVCGQEGAWVSTANDDYNYPVGEWTHSHCYPKKEDAVFYGDRLGSSRYHSFSRAKRIVVPRMRRGGRVLYLLGARKRRTGML